jgi:hypothetical protein
MSLNCSAKPTFKSLQIMHSNLDFIDEQRNADWLDARADIAYEQEQAMRESSQSDWSLVYRTDGIIGVDLVNDYTSEWDGIDEISNEERNACDHYNERYVYPTSD